MLTPDQLHDYQKKAVNFQCSHPASALWLDMGLGKQQPNSEPVLTPEGWVPMGNLSVGDQVIGSDGTPTTILGVFPQGVSEVVNVTFTDGSSCRVGWEHLWYVQNPSQKKRKQVGHVMTTRQLVDTSLTRKMGNREDAYWHIPMVQPVQFSEKQFRIDPYTLGVILGDASTPNGHVTLCTDIEILERINARRLRDHETCEYVGYGSMPGIADDVRHYGLDSKRSWEKFVPVEYMFGSVDQRLALLQGLLDTDGSPIEGGGVEFSSTSVALLDAVVDLTQSLGGVALRSAMRVTTYQGGQGRPSGRINVKLPPQFNPFRLKRKLDKWQRPTKYLPIRKMVSAEVVGTEESTCIKVAAKDSLYVTKEYIVTHNTAVTLTSITHLITSGFLKSVIIVAPIRVCRLVWRQEAQKWAHTHHLNFSMVMGTKDQRTRALLREADIYLINYENLKWMSEAVHTYFTSKGKEPPFQGIVWDEISKMKNSGTDRVRAVRKIIPNMKWTTGLTGTPASNGYKDLHGQFLVLDGGQRLGTSKTAFRTRFYKKAGPYKEVPYDDTEETIKKLIGDMTLEMSAADYNPLPDLMVNDVLIELPPDLRAKYDKMEKEFFIALDSGTEIEMFNTASLTNRCLQFSNGAMYPVAGMPLWEPIHDLKLEALEEIIDECNGQPVLVSYAYRSDAERIMKRFHDLRPINLTECKSEAALTSAMHRWKTGDCQLMIGHPACLGERTQVLTETRGWVNIVDVVQTDRVFDGVEFVSHKGCSYSGFKPVIEVAGIVMTPDHKLLIDNEWVEAKDVQDTEKFRQKGVRLRYETENYVSGRVLDVRRSARNAEAECKKEQSRESSVLRDVYPHNLSQDDQYPHLANLAGDALESTRPARQKLWWAWDRGMSRVAELREVLRGYVTNLSRRLNHRTSGREWSVLEGQLYLDIEHGATVQQAKQQICRVPRGDNPPCRAVPSQWVQQDHAHDEAEQGNDGRRGGRGCAKFPIREKSGAFSSPATAQSHVYDLVDCGPRHRFVIRNDQGEVFISHNSMGHGIDGLQDRGHTLVWFGLNWSLDLYEQFNARLRRQGQGVPVVCHRILTLDTLDQAQALALDEKASTQASLRNAVKEYRQQRGHL